MTGVSGARSRLSAVFRFLSSFFNRKIGRVVASVNPIMLCRNGADLSVGLVERCGVQRCQSHQHQFGNCRQYLQTCDLVVCNPAVSATRGLPGNPERTAVCWQHRKSALLQIRTIGSNGSLEAVSSARPSGGVACWSYTRRLLAPTSRSPMTRHFRVRIPRITPRSATSPRILATRPPHRSVSLPPRLATLLVDGAARHASMTSATGRRGDQGSVGP